MRSFCIILMLIVYFKLNCQDTLPKNKFSPSFLLFGGAIPKTYPTAPPTRHALLGAVSLNQQFNGKDKWHQFYKYPKGGVDLFFGGFDNPAALGYSIGFVPALEIKVFRKEKWRFRFGLGAAYFNKTYDVVSNPTNYYIGSHFTNMTTLSLFRKKKLKNDFIWTYGFSLLHFSNGHTQLPNVGMNILTLNTSIGFEKAVTPFSHKIAEEKNKLSYAVKLGLGMHEFGETEKAIGGPNYPSYHLSLWVSKPFRHIHLLQAGITAAYYTSFYDYITSQELNYSNNRLYASTGLIFIGHEFVFGKFSLSTQLGIYCFNRFFIDQRKITGTWDSFSEKIEAINTNRLGLIYYPFKKRNSLNNVKNQLMLGAFIKANLAQADLFEYSIGYVF